MTARKRTEPFAARIVRWQEKHGRHDLPWQGTRDAYRIWLSEIMLQQTQVGTVLPYFERFVARFPDVRALAAASEDDVLSIWSGLGYYARARNLQRAAREVVANHGGVFPASSAVLMELPGIGRSTAAAIAAFANVERYTQGMMDMGASVCLARNPHCLVCPVSADCVARLQDRIAELPGRKRRAAPRRKRIAMLVVLSRGEVLLEKRPSAGIWGGLWSLPEADAAEDPRAALARDWGLEAASVDAMEPFEHAFTHFTLEVEPWRVKLKRAARLAEGRAGMWLPLADLAGAALPSPVRKLLARAAAAA